MKLSPSQIQHFKSSGFVAVPHFFNTREVNAMQTEVATWIDQGWFRDVSTTPETRQNYQLIPLYNRSELFRTLPFAPKVATAIGDLIGHPVVKILDQSFYKPPKSGMGTHWHTDNAYFKLVNPLGGTAMWIAIHDGTDLNGTLRVIPNAMFEVFPHERDPASDHHIYSQLDDAQATVCELKAGGVVFFCFGTPHATGDNYSEEGRVGVGLHFVNQTQVAEAFRTHWQHLALSHPDGTATKLALEQSHDFDKLVEDIVLPS